MRVADAARCPAINASREVYRPATSGDQARRCRLGLIEKVRSNRLAKIGLRMVVVAALANTSLAKQTSNFAIVITR
jgi:hypothetical protein